MRWKERQLDPHDTREFGGGLLNKKDSLHIFSIQ
jgi:hypothetical protein